MDKNGYKWLAQNLKAGQTVYRKTYIDRNPSVSENSLDKICENTPCIAYENGERVLYECFSGCKTLIVCGGGHISLPLTRIAKMLGYKIYVMEDRAEFADKQRFKDADFVLCGNFKELLSEFDWEKNSDTSVVIVTRGHTADIECLREVINRNLTYVGMIGSKKKNKAIFDILEIEGVSRENIQKVFAPIGLKIGAETPEEIAVCIAAQLIEQRRGLSSAVMSEDIINALISEQRAVMATVISKVGSAPRGVGARMIMLENGDTLGTIGGGLAEHMACQKMKSFKSCDESIRFFDMSNGEAGKSGMICGGKTEVLFEIID